jgi:hypothetical protein
MTLPVEVFVAWRIGSNFHFPQVADDPSQSSCDLVIPLLSDIMTQ